MLYQEVLCLLGGELGATIAHRGKQLVPRQTIFVTQRLGLGLQVLPELGKILFHSAQHSIQSFLLHIGALQSPCQRAFIATELAIGKGLQLNGVQGKSNGVFDLIVAGNFCFVGLFPHIRIGIVSQVTNSRQSDGLAIVLYRNGAGKIPLQVAPGRAAGKLQLGCHFLCLRGQQIPAGLFHFGKAEGIGRKALLPCYQFRKIGDLTDPILESSFCACGFRQGSHNAAGLGTCFCIPGVSRLAKHSIFIELHAQVADLFLEGCAFLQAFQRRFFFQIFCQGDKCSNGIFQLLQIAGKGRVVKTLINDIQIPTFVHRKPPKNVFSIIHHFVFAVNHFIHKSNYGEKFVF